MVHLFFTLVAAVCVLADDAVEDRKTKLPYIADAVGNQIPPPSNGPAPVGSPSNLLTPDRYEFYTFDESGELVKRLMTLDEIQAIVAAGEGTEGHLVTFANDDQPNISFNFSQAPFTKVHNVVTNVQNVLKAQMEAQKNNPPLHTTLDTPDVSDSWSLILPTIFGNTGAEIIPDKSSNVHSIPETDTLELDFDENSLSKEGDSHVLSSSAATSKYEESEITTEKINDEVTELPSSTSEATTTTTTTTTTPKPTTTSTTTTTTQRPTTTTTTTVKPRTTSTTTVRPRTTSTTTVKPRTTSTTTAKPRTTSTTTTTAQPRTTSTTTTTAKPRTTTTTTTTTTVKPRVTTTVTTPKPTTTRKPSTTTSLPKKKPTTTTTTTSKPRTTTTEKATESSTTTSPKYTTAKLSTKPFTTTVAAEYSKIETIQHPSIEKNITQEENTSYVPVSTVSYVTTERSTEKPMEFHKTTYFASTTKRSVTSRLTTTASPISTKAQPAITTYKPTKITSSTTNSFITTPALQEMEKVDNITTITTQSVSPSTTESSIEFTLIDNNKKQETTEVLNDDHENEPQIPYFDIAQSFSQIASELDNDPLPTTSTIVDTTKSDGSELESKEDGEMDIHDFNNTTETRTTVVVPLNVFPDDSEKFVKISTLDPPMENKKENEAAIEQSTTTEKQNEDNLVFTTPSNLGTTIDPILFESMDDLFSQIINQNPQIVQNTEKPIKEDLPSKTTTENIKVPTIDNRINLESVTETLLIPKNKTEDKTMNKPNNSIENVKISEVTESNFSTENVSPATSEDKKYTEQILTNNNVESLSTATQSSTTQRTMAIENITQYENDKINKNKIINDTVTGHENIIQKHESTTEKLVLIHENSLNKKNSSTTTMVIDEQKNKDSNSIAEQNKVQTIQETAKLPNLKPKIDEFKKKIQKVNIDDKELINDRNSSWKLISTVKPPKINEMQKDKISNENNNVAAEPEDNKNINLDVSNENQGLAVTTKDLSEDVSQFTELCNELAFRYWHSMTEQIEKRRSFVLSPYSITSMLAMMFMGARGGTSGEMNEILKLDDMVTFNPHFTLKNISDSIETTPESGVIVSAFIRELYSDRNRGKILTFYKERAQHFYNGHVEEINFKLISDIIRRRTNLLVKRYTWGRIQEYMKANSITMQPPLAALSTNIFETDCSGTSVDGRDGEMYFVVSPTVRQRRLVPVPSVVYKKGFLAGYDPVLDATAAALGNTNSIVSTLFLMPGQQGNVVHAEDLEALERRLLDSNPTTEVFNRLLRTLLPRMGLELQIPRFSHKSIFNVSSTLKTMGLKELFDADNADLGGLNGPSKDLYLSDMVQLTTFVTCGEGVIGEQHHIEEYPERIESSRRRRTSRWAAGWDEPRDYQRAFHDPHDVGDAMHLPLHLRPRQARLPSRNAQPARLKFDRPFLFFVRHNPSGMILYVGRYNPRLLP